MIVPVIIGDLGDAMKKTMNELTRLFTKQELAVKTGAEIQKTIIMDREALLRKVFYGLAQSDKEKNRSFFLIVTSLWFYGLVNPTMHLSFTLAIP